MAGNIRGVLIFVVDLAVTKFSHPRKLMPTVICESIMMGVATNIVAAWPQTLSSISKQGVYSSHCMVAYSTLIFYLMLFVKSP